MKPRPVGQVCGTMDYIPDATTILAAKARPVPVQPRAPRRTSSVKTMMRTRPLPGNSTPTRRICNQNGASAAAYIASLTEEFVARPAGFRMGTDNLGPVAVLRVGSDCSGIGRALGCSTDRCQAACLVHGNTTHLATCCWNLLDSLIFDHTCYIQPMLSNLIKQTNFR